MIYVMGLGLAIVILLQVVLILRKDKNEIGVLQTKFDGIISNQERLEKTVKEEIVTTRKEVNDALKSNREELLSTLKGSSETIGKKIEEAFKTITEKLDSAHKTFGLEITTNRKEISEALRNNREELAVSIKNTTASLLSQIKELNGTVENKLNSLQADNNAKLEKMRETVDEKLHSTLEKRLGESFKLVTDKLESVQKGFGEMQQLAVGVGDLKKVMMNVKSRGGWSEIQLGRIIEDFLMPEQYEKNVAVKSGAKEKVEYAIKFPGLIEGKCTWLPIDAKFPKEDYERIVDAQEKCDAAAVELHSKALESRIRAEAKDIKDKYISPPETTDFAVMFLPTEGLYAEVIRRPGFSDKIQKDFRVLMAGPTILAALLNSLQMGFKTLAIQKKTGEVWQLLETIKGEFGKFGDLLDKTKEKIDLAGKTIDDAVKKSRTIESKLKKVQRLEEKVDPMMLESFPIGEENTTETKEDDENVPF